MDSQNINSDQCKGIKHNATSLPFYRSQIRIPKLRNSDFDCTKSVLELYARRCGYNTFSTLSMKDHVKFIHRRVIEHEKFVVKYRCQACSSETFSCLIMLKHLVQMGCMPLLTKLFCCCKCQFSTRAAGYMNRHINTAHKAEDLKCSDCNYTATRRSRLKAHFKLRHVSDENIDWFKCHDCEYKTKQKSGLSNHVLSKHTRHEDIKWFFCDNCDYQAKQQNTLQKHVTAKHTNHESVKWFKCDKCQHRTKVKANLRRHMLAMHTDEDIKNQVV